MLNIQKVQEKIAEDFWLSRLKHIPVLLTTQYSNPDDRFCRRDSETLFPDVLGRQLEAVAYGKKYNKFLFLTAALYIWLRRHSGNAGRQLLTMPALITDHLKPATNLIFTEINPAPDDSIRTLLRQIHEDIQEHGGKTDYDLSSLMSRGTIPPVAISYGGVHQTGTLLQQAGLVFSFEETPECGMILTVCAQDVGFAFNDLRAPAMQYLAILNEICHNLELTVGKVEMVPEEDLLLIKEINDNAFEYGEHHTFLSMFAHHVAYSPDRPAVIAGRRSLSYAELDRESERVAVYLKNEAKLEPGEIVGIILGHDLQRIIGILGVLKVGAAYLPIKSDFPVKRIRFMLEDSHCRLLLTDVCFRELGLQTGVDAVIFMQDIAIIAGNQLPVVNKNNPFVVLYTSGSSGTPKGVVLNHSNMIDRLLGEVRLYGLSDGICTIQTSNYAFDSSLLDLFLPLITGGRLVIPLEEELSDYERLATLIDEEGVTDLQANPNFLKGFMEACRGLKRDFANSLRRIWSGGESLTRTLVEEARKTFVNAMISNHYGPTEGTVDAIVYKDIRVFDRNIIGKPIFNMNAYIMDELQMLQPVGLPGEICISGRGLAKEYQNLPGITKEKFIPHPLKAGELLYRTGDLGRLLRDGNIEYLGRIDDQIKIRGYRIELGEVENVIIKHAPVKQVVVLPGADSDGMKFLVAYLIVNENFEVPLLRSFLYTELPDFMVPSYFIVLKKFPITAMGKIDRKALENTSREFIYSSENIVLPKNHTEEKLFEMYSQVLCREHISTDSNFFEIGGQSLKATQLIFRIYRDLKVKLQLRDIFRYPSIISLSDHLKSVKPDIYIPITPVPGADFYSTSGAQKRIWIISQETNISIAYNLPDAYYLDGPVNLNAFAKACYTVIDRHESLRTTFFLLEDDLKQQVNSTTQVFAAAYRYDDISDQTAEAKEAFIQEKIFEITSTAFNFETGPLIKARIAKLSENRYAFFFCTHHIISDEWSMEVFIEEFLLYYREYTTGVEAGLPAPEIQYKDYVAYRIRYAGELKIQEAFWMKMLGEQIPRLQLPLDVARTYEQGNEYYCRSVFDDKLTELVRGFSTKEDTTVFSVLFAAFNVFLYKICGQEDVVVGTITSGRNNPELESVIGLFVNTVALRNYPAGEKTFHTFFREVKERTLEAFMHLDYDFEELVKKMGVERAHNRNPLFDVLFEFQNFIDVKPEGFLMRPFEAEFHPVAKFDVTVSVSESEHGISVLWSYNSSIFYESTIRKMAVYYIETVRVLLSRPDILLKEVDLISHVNGKQAGLEMAEGESQLFNF